MTGVQFTGLAAAGSSVGELLRADVLSESESDIQLPDVGDLLALRHSSRDPLAFVTTLSWLPSRAELHADAAAPKKDHASRS